jgi:hypothetical protein
MCAKKCGGVERENAPPAQAVGCDVSEANLAVRGDRDGLAGVFTLG